MIESRLTSKAQTTIPAAVRRALHLSTGDSLVYRIEEGRVVLTKGRAATDDPFASFTEWAGEADSRAYADF